mgnify:FL=1
MLAEFYILLVPLTYYWLIQKSDIHKIFKIIIFALIHVVVFVTKSRSAYLGLGLWWTLWLYEYYFYRYLKAFLAIGLIVIVSLVTFFYKSDSYLSQIKSGSTAERMNFYRSAIDLIKGRPLGVGSQYANQIVPYRLQYPVGPYETEYPDQPHSEVLKWGVEFGWLGLAVSLFCLGYVSWLTATGGSFLLKGAYLVIVPQLLFQFPFENPATILLLSIYLYLFAKSLPQQTINWNKPFKVISLILGVGLIYYSVVFMTSVYFESNYPDSLEKTTQACWWNPAYFRGCVRKNYNLLQARQYGELKKSLKDEMRSNYYGADYLKILSEAVSEGNLEPDLVMQDEGLTSIAVYGSVKNQSRTIKKTCQILHVYVFIYKAQTYYSDEDIKACHDVAAPFDLNLKPAAFDREYKNWLTTILK